MISFFMLLSELSEEQDNCGKLWKALRAHFFPVNVNLTDCEQICELMSYAANHPLKPNSGNFLSTMGEDTVA